MAVSFPRADIQLHYNRNRVAWQQELDTTYHRDKHYRIIGDASTEIPAPALLPVRESFDKNKDAQKILHNLSKVIQAVPHAAPSLELLEDLAIESKQVNDALDLKNSTAGSCMVYGSAESVGTGGRDFRRTPILVYVSGPTGCDIGIASIVEDYGPMLENPDYKFNTHKISRMSKYADQLDIPIRQLCSGEHFDGSYKPYLAVRTDSYAQYFKVLDFRTSSGTDQRFRLKSIGVIKQDHTKTMYCDMSINPWFEKELGLIDDKGHWEVWDCMPKRHGENRPQTIFQGTISRDSSKDYRCQGRIIWGKDVRSLMISNGRAVYLVDLRNDPIQTVKLEMRETFPLDNSILSLSRCISVPDHVFVLTNYFVLCLVLKPDVRHILTRKHFRHSLDLSLRMMAVKNRRRLTMLLFSNINRDISILNFISNDASSLQHYGEISSIRLTNVAKRTMSILSWEAVRKKELGAQSKDQTSTDVTSNDIHCLVIFLQCDSFVVIRQYIADADLDLQLVKKKRLHTRSREPQNLFVNDSSSEDSDDMTHGFVDVRPQWSQRLTSTGDISRGLSSFYISKRTDTHGRLHSSYNFHPLYMAVFDGLIHGNNSSVEALDASKLFISSMLDTVKHLYVSTPTSASTMLELSTSQPLIDNIDTFMQEIMKAYKFISFSQVQLEEPEASVHTMIAPHWALLYQRLLTNYLVPLPEKTQLRFKLQRERVARMVTIDHFLACQVLCLSNPQFETARRSCTPANSSSRRLVLICWNGPAEASVDATSVLLEESREIAMVPESTEGVLESSSIHSQNVDMQLGDVPDLNVRENQPLFDSTPYLEAFGCATSKLSSSHDLSSLLEDWRIGEDPVEYTWAPINKRQRGSSRDSIKRKRSRSRHGREKSTSVVHNSQPSTGWSLPSNQPFSNSQDAFSSMQHMSNSLQRLTRYDRPSSPQMNEDEYGGISSQIVSGRYGGRRPLITGKKQKKKRTAGF